MGCLITVYSTLFIFRLVNWEVWMNVSEKGLDKKEKRVVLKSILWFIVPFREEAFFACVWSLLICGSHF